MSDKKSETPTDRIFRWLRESGGNQDWLAEQLGVGKGAVSIWKRRGVPPEHFEKIAEVFGRSTDEIYGREIAHSAAPDRGLLRIPLKGFAWPGKAGLTMRIVPPTAEQAGFVDMPSRSRLAYAIQIFAVDAAMGTRYQPGEYVVIEPDRDVSPNDEVFVTLRDGEGIFRYFVSQQRDCVVLRDLRGDHMTVLHEQVVSVEFVAAIAKDVWFIPAASSGGSADASKRRLPVSPDGRPVRRSSGRRRG